MNPGSSPTKRRAALATLDANAMATTTSTTPTSKHAADGNGDHASISPLKPLSAKRRTSGLLSSAPVLAPPVTLPPSSGSGGAPSVGMKRSSGIMVLQDSETVAEQVVVKKNKLAHSTQEEAPTTTTTSTQSSRTHSPDASSVFDAEAGQEDTTWATTATEPDAAAAVMTMPVVARPPRVVLTREQAREKVEILRLRLGLASYKLRTGQVEVPLANLQARPLPPAVTTVENTPENSQGSSQGNLREGAAQQQDEDEPEEDVVAATPPPADTAAR